MTQQRIVLAALVCLGLATACSPPAQEGAAPQSAEQAQANVAVVNQTLEPGQWRTTITLTEANIPGMPAGMAQSMMGEPTSFEECRTTADAEELSREWAQDETAGCGAGTFRVTGNRFEGEQTCTEDGTTTTMRYSGTITATRMEGVSELNAQTPAGPMSQRATVVSERLGPCPG